MICVEDRAYMRHGEVGRAVLDQSVPQCVMSDRQILADQGIRRRLPRQVTEHLLLCVYNLRIGPVISYAIAEAVLQIVIELAAACVIIFAPVPWVGLHAGD